MRVLAGSKFRGYPRERWTGADLAMNDVCLLESVHSLGSQTWARYCATQSASGDLHEVGVAQLHTDAAEIAPCAEVAALHASALFGDRSLGSAHVVSHMQNAFGDNDEADEECANQKLERARSVREATSWWNS